MTVPLRWGADGLIPVVTVDDSTGAVLMLAFMNEQALAATRATGEIHYWSRSRNTLWHKGATSGHVQQLVSIHVNCDQNSLLLRVNQTGAVCHEGFETCFYRRLESDNTLTTTMERLVDPALMYGSAPLLPEDQPKTEAPLAMRSGDAAADGQPSLKQTRGVMKRNVNAALPLGFVVTDEFPRDMSLDAARLLVAAYRALNDPALTPLSGTARLLQGPAGATLPRLADELDELAGVLDGTHGHGAFQDDVQLEGSQCLYWSLLPLIQAGFGEDDLPLATWLETPLDPASREDAADRLRAFARAWRSSPPAPDSLLARTSAVYPLLAAACRSAGMEPTALIARDLAALRDKPYLAGVFQWREPSGHSATSPAE